MSSNAFDRPVERVSREHLPMLTNNAASPRCRAIRTPCLSGATDGEYRYMLISGSESFDSPEEKFVLGLAREILRMIGPAIRRASAL
jgi:hypothetical protein